MFPFSGVFVLHGCSQLLYFSQYFLSVLIQHHLERTYCSFVVTLNKQFFKTYAFFEGKFINMLNSVQSIRRIFYLIQSIETEPRFGCRLQGEPNS